MIFTQTEQRRGEWVAWGMRAVMVLMLGWMIVSTLGCTGLLIDKETRAMLREVVASGDLTADDPEVVVEFGHSYFMRIALANTKITAKVAVKGDKAEPD